MKGTIIVAHPDDEALFCGLLQKYFDLDWTIVIIGTSPDSQRYAESVQWQSTFDRPAGILCMGQPDNPHDFDTKISTWDVNSLVGSLAKLDLGDLVVTHNAIGEYHHPHHKSVHHAVTTLVKKPLFFGYGLRDPDIVLHGDKNHLRDVFPTQSWTLDMINPMMETFTWRK